MFSHDGQQVGHIRIGTHDGERCQEDIPSDQKGFQVKWLAILHQLLSAKEEHNIGDAQDHGDLQVFLHPGWSGEGGMELHDGEGKTSEWCQVV